MTRIIIGCDQLGNSDWGDSKILETMRAIEYAYDCGLRKFDIADVYGLGIAEARLGALLYDKSGPVEVTTKVGVNWVIDSAWQRAKTTHEESTEYLQIAIANSLRRLEGLKVKRILLHWPKTLIGISSAMKLFDDYRANGKVDDFGFCNVDPLIDEIIKLNNPLLMRTYQTSFSLFENRDELMKKLYKRFNLTMLYGIFCHGLLAWDCYQDRVLRKDDRRSRMNIYNLQNKKCLDILLRKIKEVSNAYRINNSTLILNCTLKKTKRAEIIIGVNKLEHVKNIMEAEQVLISDSDYQYVLKLLQETSFLISR